MSVFRAGFLRAARKIAPVWRLEFLVLRGGWFLWAKGSVVSARDRNSGSFIFRNTSGGPGGAEGVLAIS